MKLSNRVALLAIGCLVVTGLAAQPATRPQKQGEFRADVRLQGWVFGNFFYVTDDQVQEDVLAFRTEARAGYRPWTRPAVLYAHVNYLTYEGAVRDPSYGARIGIAEETDVQGYNFWVDRGENRATVDVGDRFAIANVTSVGGEYSRKISSLWQLGAEGSHERQRYDIESEQENEYTGIQGSVRYRGFGWKFSPIVGYGVGQRDSRDPAEVNDERWWFAQVSVIPHPRVYTSLRYRHGTREYEIDDPRSSNFNRVDDRPNWTLSGSVRLTDRVSWQLYYSRTAVKASIPNRDVDTFYLLTGLTIGL